MIDRAVYGNQMHMTELSVKDDEVACPKASLKHSGVCTFFSQKENILLGRGVSRRNGTQPELIKLV